MGVYKTYQEAVLARGSTEGIYTPHKEWTGKDKSWIGQFVTKDTLTVPMVGYGKWVECNPADHLDTLEDFRDNDKKLEASDIVTLLSGEVFILSEKDPEVWNEQSDNDDKRFVVQAADDQDEVTVRDNLSRGENLFIGDNLLNPDDMDSPEELETFHSTPWKFDAIETSEEKEVIDTTPQQQFESLSGQGKPNTSEWEKENIWDDEGYADFMPSAKGISVLAYINSEVNGINGKAAKWVDAITVLKYKATNGGVACIVEHEGEYYSIPSTTYLRKPETPAEREERERLEVAYDLYCAVRAKTDGYTMTFNQFEKCKVGEEYLTILDKTGYRKKESK